MKKVLVTGASGFIGRHCLNKLIQRDFEVHAISSKNIPQQTDVTWHQIDLFDSRQVKELFKNNYFDSLLHLAWYAEHGLFWHSSQNLRWVNSSLELAEQFALHGGKRCVAAGTCAEYAWLGNPCKEDSLTQPETLYGAAKNGLKAILEKFFFQEKISFCWGRIFYPYGPYEKSGRLVAFVIQSLLKKKIATCTHGEQLRDFLYVEDAADLFALLVDSNIEGAINIGSGQPIAIKHVCNKIASSLDALNLLKMGAIEAPRHDTPLLVADVKRLENELKWMPKVSVEEGLEKTIEWWKKVEEKHEVNN